MTTVTVKNIPPELYSQLERVAKQNGRSINNEVIVCLERALLGHKRSIEDILEEAKQLRTLTADYTLTEEELDQTKQAGRP